MCAAPAGGVLRKASAACRVEEGGPRECCTVHGRRRRGRRWWWTIQSAAITRIPQQWFHATSRAANPCEHMRGCSGTSVSSEMPQSIFSLFTILFLHLRILRSVS